MAASHGLIERRFILSVTKQTVVVMNGLITDSPNRLKLRIPSLTKHRCCTSSVADFAGNIIISL